MSAPVISFEGVVALLGRFPALSGIDLRIDRGEIVLLRGANGSGKTTVLRACAGLVPVTHGLARVLDTPLPARSTDLRTLRRRIGLLGHAGFLYEDLTVEENVRFAVRAAGLDGASVSEALTRLGLDGRLRTQSVASLSAGQRRRTALAPILARRPELWLLDEPHAGLDAESRDLLDGLLRDVVRGGATVVFASHELDRAEAVATRTIVLGGGHAVTAEPASLSRTGSTRPESPHSATAYPATAHPESAHPASVVARVA